MTQPRSLDLCSKLPVGYVHTCLLLQFPVLLCCYLTVILLLKSTFYSLTLGFRFLFITCYVVEIYWNIHCLLLPVPWLFFLSPIKETTRTCSKNQFRAYQLSLKFCNVIPWKGTSHFLDLLNPLYNSVLWTFTGWWFGTFGLFFHSVGNNISSQLTNSIIFQRGRYTTNQIWFGTSFIVLWCFMNIWYPTNYKTGLYKTPFKTIQSQAPFSNSFLHSPE